MKRLILATVVLLTACASFDRQTTNLLYDVNGKVSQSIQSLVNDYLTITTVAQAYDVVSYSNTTFSIMGSDVGADKLRQVSWIQSRMDRYIAELREAMASMDNDGAERAQFAAVTQILYELTRLGLKTRETYDVRRSISDSYGGIAAVSNAMHVAITLIMAEAETKYGLASMAINTQFKATKSIESVRDMQRINAAISGMRNVAAALDSYFVMLPAVNDQIYNDVEVKLGWWRLNGTPTNRVVKPLKSLANTLDYYGN